jgi:hypothetical protein
VIVGMGEFARAVYDGPEDFTLRAWRFYNDSGRRV